MPAIAARIWIGIVISAESRLLMSPLWRRFPWISFYVSQKIRNWFSGKESVLQPPPTINGDKHSDGTDYNGIFRHEKPSSFSLKCNPLFADPKNGKLRLPFPRRPGQEEDQVPSARRLSNYDRFLYSIDSPEAVGAGGEKDSSREIVANRIKLLTFQLRFLMDIFRSNWICIENCLILRAGKASNAETRKDKLKRKHLLLPASPECNRQEALSQNKIELSTFGQKLYESLKFYSVRMLA